MFLKNILSPKQNGAIVLTHRLTMIEKWKLGLTIFGGKAIGLLLVIVAIKFLPSLLGTAAIAQGYTAHETSMINSINTVWTLVAAFLVFGMQAGFVMLEAGFARTK